MNKKGKGLIKVLLSLCLAWCCFSGLIFKGGERIARAGASEIVLASGNHEKWIDRIDFTDNVYARDFYDWLVENTDNDGEQDALIDFHEEQHVLYVIEESFTVDPSSGDVETLVSDELTARVNANFSRVSGYCSMAYSAFNRDRNEVFWLRRDMVSLSSLECTYNQAGEARYTQTVSMLIKNDDPSDDISDYDMRLSIYKDGTFDIKEQINAVNQAVQNILSEVEAEASYYEKVKHFNKWLTENNCYAKTVTENSRDVRGALLGQNGNSNYAPVCEGYARAFKLLCDRADIPCVLTSGSANGEDHMWNLVKMENGSWYGVDVTWNDPTVVGVTDKQSFSENEDYLLVGSNTQIDGERFGVSHVEINKTYEDKPALSNGPAIALDDYGAPVIEHEWNISKVGGVDTVVATLYQAEGYTALNPVYKLIISGFGEVEEYLTQASCPWSVYADKIVEIEIRSGVNEVTGVAFNGFISLEKVYVYANLNFGNNVFESGGFIFYCHQNYPCYQKAEGLGFTVSAICEINSWTVVNPQGCEQDEILRGECNDCGHVATKTGELASGHDFNEWIVENAPTATAGGTISRSCKNDQTHVESFDLPSLNEVDYAYSVVEAPECEAIGKGKYVFVKDGQNIEIECDIEPIGHDFAPPTYEWNYLLKTCVARRVCQNDSTHVETEEAIAQTDREVDCSTSGYVTFTASFVNNAFETQERVEYLMAKPHEYKQELSFDENSHWVECANCLNKKDEQPHGYSEWEIKKDASLFFEGLKVRECECGHKQEEIIPRVSFLDALLSGNISGDMWFILIVGGSLIGIILLIIIIKAICKKRR